MPHGVSSTLPSNPTASSVWQSASALRARASAPAMASSAERGCSATPESTSTASTNRLGHTLRSARAAASRLIGFTEPTAADSSGVAASPASCALVGWMTSSSSP